MLITLERLREIKSNLPPGSIKQIANKLNAEEQQVEKFFEANSASSDQASEWYRQVGPSRDILKIENPIILNFAKQLIMESKNMISKTNIAINRSRKLLR